jgi:hypothetical protein
MLRFEKMIGEKRQWGSRRMPDASALQKSRPNSVGRLK